MKGIVFGIQSFCVDDGPGIRTCVYLKGCNMRCAWCHNPESWSLNPEISFIGNKCTRCGQCAQVCSAHKISGNLHHFDRAACNCAGKDAAVCPTGALSTVGESMDAVDVLNRVARDERYFRKSGGGLTITGGEPMMQPEFLKALLAGAKERGIHTCIETNGAFPTKAYLQLLPLVDIFLMDYKITDDQLHRQLTGVSNQQVIENIETISRSGAKLVIRCPIIPGINDHEAHFSAIARMSSELPVLGYEIMPYHSLGVSKAERVGQKIQSYAVPNAETVAQWKQTIQSFGGIEWRRDQ